MDRCFSIYIALLLLFNALVILIKPSPESLKEPPISYVGHIKSILGTLLIGNITLVLYLFPVQPVPLNNYFFWFFLAPFFHVNLIHLLTNVSAMGILSLYEKKAGFKRYLMIFLSSILLSSLSSFFYEGGSIGISGGVFGLGAAFLIDQKDHSRKSFIVSLLGLCILFILMSLDSGSKISSIAEMEVDHIGHGLGVIAAVLYVMFRPLKKN